MPRITLTSVFVDDQEAALRFYVDVLGFRPKNDVPLGDEMRWLTVVHPDAPDGVELVLEPPITPPSPRSRTRSSPTASRRPPSASTDVRAEYERLAAVGVRFTQEPVTFGDMTLAVLDDTQGNLVQLAAAGSEADPEEH